MNKAPQLGQKLKEFDAPRRTVNRVFIHCSAASRRSIDAKEVDRWHRERGRSCIGYHLFIKTDGTVEMGRDISIIPAAQAKHNIGTIAICVNGLNVSDFTESQFDALRELCGDIHKQIPHATFHGHCEVSFKSCPVFDYKKVLGLVNGKLGLAPRVDTEDEAEIVISRKKVMDWQKSNGLYPDGIVGPKTWAELTK